MFKRFVMGVIMAMAGAWLITALHLNMVRHFLSLDQYETVSFFLDFLFSALALFGLFTILFILPRIRARLDRVEALGERDW